MNDGERKMLRVGSTLSFKTTDRYLSPHKFGLYLGKDSEGQKILIPSFLSGFKIVDVKDVDSESYSVNGYFNIREEQSDPKSKVVNYFKYVFFDVVGESIKEILVDVSREDDVWKITEINKKPSWYRGERV